MSVVVWERPLPSVSPETRPFWDAVDEGRFVVQRCRACERWQYPYRGFCCHCWSGELEVSDAVGGTVFTHSTIFKNDTPGFPDVVPYVAAMVQLDDDCGGVMVNTNVVDCEPDEVHIGMRVEVVFKDTVEGRKIPMFTPRRDEADAGA